MADSVSAIDDLRLRDAAQIDPIRFHFIEALARRVQGFQGEARRLLEARLASELAACAARCAQAKPAQPVLENVRHESPLADLLAHLAQATGNAEPDDSAALAYTQHTPLAELKSLSQFRTTWSRLSIEQQISAALAQVPENAGPLNSHLLVLRALERMRDVAPDYLTQFVSYADALLWLERVDMAVIAKRQG